ncbi:MAG: glycosyltransferase [Candidatus Abyssobacteria bacterium SURF_17]|uniref:Glycosyltransferase n=1 Tax=Candidatus Abyssobacteria bacterium SURF_17 TaxID=2093361 RepID=A0A419F2H0_9BACT|nr:MAG: glycosyltransferase [Candidatus Abyssubacteria bacterium SURF_17]
MVQRNLEIPTISVVVVNYNGRKFLGDCIDSVFSQTLPPAEVLIVDNASTDGSDTFVKEAYPRAKLIPTGENAGFARAANRGIRESTGQFIALLNNDAVADEHWLEWLIRPALADDAIGLCASKMLFSWDKNRMNNAGIGITDYGLPYDRGFHVTNHQAFAADRFVFGACGGAALLRRSMFERTGLFDEDFFLCYDDADLSFRAQLMGYTCMYVANAVVYHAGGATVPYYGGTARFYSCRHYIVLVTKNMPGRLLRRRLGSILWYVAKNTLSSVIQHKDFVNLRGYLSGLAALRRNLVLRRQIQGGIAVPLEYIASLMVSKGQMLQETASPPRK